LLSMKLTRRELLSLPAVLWVNRSRASQTLPRNVILYGNEADLPAVIQDLSSLHGSVSDAAVETSVLDFSLLKTCG
jgi:hypothetical protein